jgi:hypothetical protein
MDKGWWMVSSPHGRVMSSKSEVTSATGPGWRSDGGIDRVLIAVETDDAFRAVPVTRPEVPHER